MSNDNHFVGFENYVNIFKDKEFLNAFVHSITIVVFAVPIQTFLSLMMALLINMKFRGRGVFRTIFYSPYVISPIAVATVFMYLFTEDQPIVKFFTLFGLENTSWAVSVRYALPLVIMMYIWQQCGFYMIMFLSGLQTISPEIMEAAEIDGANKIQTFWHVTFPVLRPTTFLVITYGVITSFQVFDQISAIAGQGLSLIHIYYEDGVAIRRCATENNITMLTSLDTVKVLLDVLEETTIGISTIDS